MVSARLLYNPLTFYTLFSVITALAYPRSKNNIDKREISDSIDKDYDYKWFDNHNRRENIIRDQFLARKRQMRKSSFFDRHYANDTVNVNGIPHFEINEKRPNYEKVIEYEDDFKKLISMKYYKYMYLRDNNWRTWRKIEEDNGSGSVICYRCENNINGSCAGSGYWVIEEGLPPCPYEFLSLMKKDYICAAKVDQYNMFFEDGINSACPLKMKYVDLTVTCDNPIITRWRFQKIYDVKYDRLPKAVCAGEDLCQLVTTYTIDPTQIVFRIINRTNDVVYSRVMRENKSYACIHDCGRFDPVTTNVRKNDNKNKPTSINMLPNKKKRDYPRDHPYKMLRITNRSDIIRPVNSLVKFEQSHEVKQYSMFKRSAFSDVFLMFLTTKKPHFMVYKHSQREPQEQNDVNDEFSF